MQVLRFARRAIRVREKATRKGALTATVQANYTRSLPFGKQAANVTYSYDAGWFAEPDNRLKQAPYRVLNLSVSMGLPDDSLELKFYGKNMLNAACASDGTGGPSP